MECSICLRDAMEEPVVTRCGHVFCWACLYRWAWLPGEWRLNQDRAPCPICGHAHALLWASPSCCPVCSASLPDPALHVTPIYMHSRHHVTPISMHSRLHVTPISTPTPDRGPPQEEEEEEEASVVPVPPRPKPRPLRPPQNPRDSSPATASTTPPPNPCPITHHVSRPSSRSNPDYHTSPRAMLHRRDHDPLHDHFTMPNFAAYIVQQHDHQGSADSPLAAIDDPRTLTINDDDRHGNHEDDHDDGYDNIIGYLRATGALITSIVDSLFRSYVNIGAACMIKRRSISIG